MLSASEEEEVENESGSELDHQQLVEVILKPYWQHDCHLLCAR